MVTFEDKNNDAEQLNYFFNIFFFCINLRDDLQPRFTGTQMEKQIIFSM